MKYLRLFSAWFYSANLKVEHWIFVNMCPNEFEHRENLSAHAIILEFENEALRKTLARGGEIAMWRPEENWDEKITDENLPCFKQGTQEWLQTYHGVKIGADAMLEALRKEGQHYNAGAILDAGIIMDVAKPGTLVLIPDNELTDKEVKEA